MAFTLPDDDEGMKIGDLMFLNGVGLGDGSVSLGHSASSKSSQQVELPAEVDSENELSNRHVKYLSFCTYKHTQMFYKHTISKT